MSLWFSSRISWLILEVHVLIYSFSSISIFYHGQMHAFYEMTQQMIENRVERNQFSSCVDPHQELWGIRAIAYVPVLVSFDGLGQRHERWQQQDPQGFTLDVWIKLRRSWLELDIAMCSYACIVYSVHFSFVVVGQLKIEY
jgi:hypothetical protein